MPDKSITDLRWEAAARNQVRFDPGRPCQYGHWAERYVTSGRCVECHAETKRKQQEALRQLRERSRGADEEEAK